MRLVVKQGDRTINEFQFTEGPIYIGRRSSSQITLPDGAVSKQHAVISSADDGKWTVEDLDSANKTYLNDEVIQKAEIKTGDSLRITDFTIEINLDEDVEADKPAELEDTTTTMITFRGPQIIIRKLGAEKAPPVRFPAERAVDFLQATGAIGKADNIDKLLLVLLNIISKQFNTYHVWCALRNQPGGPMTCHAGKQRDGQSVQLSDIKLSEKITEAIEKNEFLLFVFSRVPNQEDRKQIRTVLIAPVMSPASCFGVLYADNTFINDHYNLGDLDYLMLLAIHTAAILEKL